MSHQAKENNNREQDHHGKKPQGKKTPGELREEIQDLGTGERLREFALNKARESLAEYRDKFGDDQVDALSQHVAGEFHIDVVTSNIAHFAVLQLDRLQLAAVRRPRWWADRLISGSITAGLTTGAILGVGVLRERLRAREAAAGGDAGVDSTSPFAETPSYRASPRPPVRGRRTEEGAQVTPIAGAN